MVTPDILDRLDDVLASFAPSHMREIRRLNSEIERLNQKIAVLEKNIKDIGKSDGEKLVDNLDKLC